MSEPFLAEITIFAGNFAPRGWAFCDGTLLQVSQNTALFSLLGTIYGGDGRTTFALPDLRGRAIIGPGNGPGLTSRREGEKAGVESVTLNVGQMASHSHGVSGTATLGAQTGNADTHEPGPARVLSVPTIQGNPGLNLYSTSAPDTDIEGAEVSIASVGNSGGGQAHTNMMPFQTLNYIIALVGTFPSRS